MSVGSVGASPALPARSQDLSAASDERLLRAIAAGEESALGALVHRYGPAALASTSALLRSPSAEAVTTDIFRDVWRGSEIYDPAKGTVGSWLLGLVHRRAIDLARGQPSKRRDPDDHTAVTPGFGVSSAGEALRLLPAQQRHIVELMYFDGLSVSEVSERLGIARAVVSVGCRSAMRALGDEPGRPSE